MRKLIVAMTVLMSLAACGNKNTKPDVPAVPGTLAGVQTTVNIDQAMLEDCQDFSDIKINPKPSDVLTQHGQDVLVKNCWKEKFVALRNTVKGAFNIQEKGKFK
jgi:hypothetical protein